jgi:CHAD domain-containing protein
MMGLELGNVRKPVRQLRRSLKRLPDDPPMNDVHNLRTCARRLQAIVTALTPVKKQPTRHLLKTLKPVCKAAGKVRDMDVLSARALTLAGHLHDDSLALLLEHLHAVRIESAHKLVNTVAEHRKDARSSLKHFSSQIEARFQAPHPHAGAASRLMDELSRWPPFNAENLHAFRIKVKQLRYVLQLAEGANLKFVAALETVKERIGDWHDWQELGIIAGEVLDTGKDRALLCEIDEIASRKFNHALTAAYATKKRYFGAYRGIMIAEP